MIHVNTILETIIAIDLGGRLSLAGLLHLSGTANYVKFSGSSNTSTVFTRVLHVAPVGNNHVTHEHPQIIIMMIGMSWDA